MLLSHLRKGQVIKTANQAVPQGNMKGERVSPDVFQYRRWQGENSASARSRRQLFSMILMFLAWSFETEEQFPWILMPLDFQAHVMLVSFHK